MRLRVYPLPARAVEPFDEQDIFTAHSLDAAFCGADAALPRQPQHRAFDMFCVPTIIGPRKLGDPQLSLVLNDGLGAGSAH
jgi:hypothetical protein